MEELLFAHSKAVWLNCFQLSPPRGSIANTESVGYHASKGAVAMIAKSLARGLSGHEIRVVSAAPGWVHTETIDDTVAEIGGALHMKGGSIEP